MNTQWIVGQRVGFIVSALSHPSIGQLSIAGGAGFNWNRRYSSSDHHASPTSDPALWTQSLAWNLSLQYVPLNWLVASAGLSHGSPIRRNGVRNPFFIHRDMTELNVSITLMY